jgi:hypothetical protein
MASILRRTLVLGHFGQPLPAALQHASNFKDQLVGQPLCSFHHIITMISAKTRNSLVKLPFVCIER